ncbi:WD40 repeat protein [Saccharothrix variisporea]|uniref:WD40 repeat protein n=2 Tax=Saccharothrix variisporea TaxID=543527 RepID=A0A495XJ03_9PSEU|nr:WD40 repeat protein [Saccharothrix variisporea]
MGITAIGGHNRRWSADLALIGAAINASAHIVAGEPGQLAAQLLLRLEAAEGPPAGLGALLQAAARDRGRPWLKPLRASLRPSPSLSRTLPAGNGGGECVALAPDGSKVVAPLARDTLGVWNPRTGERLLRLTGHTDLVRAAAVTADGTRAVSVAEDHTLRMWNLRTGSLERTWEPPFLSALTVAVTPEGHHAVVAREHHPIALVDVFGSRRVATLAGHARLIRAIVVTPDGRHAVSVGWDATARLWDLSTGHQVRELHLADLVGESTALSPDGRTAALGLHDGSIALWDLGSGAVTTTRPGHTSLIRCLAFTADGRLLSGGRDRLLLVWDVGTGEVTMHLAAHDEEVGAIAVVPGGGFVVTADREVKMWSLDTGELRATLGRHDNSVTSVAVTADGRLAVSTDGGGAVGFWDLVGGRTAPGPDIPPARAVAVVDNRLVAVDDEQIRVHDLDTGEVLARSDDPAITGGVVAVVPTASPAASRGPGGSPAVASLPILVTCEDHPVELRNLDTGARTSSLPGHTRYVRGLAVSADGRRLVSVSWDRTLRLWELPEGRPAMTLHLPDMSGQDVALSADGLLALVPDIYGGAYVWDLERGAVRSRLHVDADLTDRVNAVALSPEGDVAVTGSQDGTVRVWDVPSGECRNVSTGHSNGVGALALSRNTSLAVSAGIDRTVRVWALDRPGGTSPPVGHTRFVRGLAGVPDKGLLVSASDDNEMHVWDTRTGHRLRTLTGHDNGVWAVLASPMGDKLLSGSADHTLRLWELPGGRLLHVLEGHGEKVCALAMSADGTLAVSGAYEETVIVWDLRTGRPRHLLHGHRSLVSDVAITPDGRLVVSAGMDRTVRVWDARSGEALAVWEAHPDVVETVAISPDGGTLLSGGIGDDRVRFWDLRTLEPGPSAFGPFSSVDRVVVGRDGTALCVVDDTWQRSLSVLDLRRARWRRHLTGHADVVGDIALGGDDRLAASVSLDHTVRLWDLHDGVELARLTVDTGLVAVAMAPDGSWLAAGGESGAVHLLQPVGPGVHGVRRRLEERG